LTPDLEAKLAQAHAQGFQRICSFESQGGGFGWYGARPGHVLLTAYGVMFLADLAKVHPCDKGILDRAVAFLERSQDAQGRWHGDGSHTTWRKLGDAALPSTAYVAWALRKAGRDDTPVLGRAEQYLRKADTGDAYALSLLANAYPWEKNVDILAKVQKDDHWTTELESWNHARGRAAEIETTALAVLALAKRRPDLADQGAAWLVRQKDPHGSWGSTQATVLALQALAATGGGAKGKGAPARLWVNGKEIEKAFAAGDEVQSYDISPFLKPGANEVTIESEARVNAQVSGRSYVPWSTEDVVRGVEGLNLIVSYDRLEAKVGETVTCTVKVEADGFMVIAEVAIPPGFTVDAGALEDLVRRNVVDKYAQTGRALTFYLPGKGGAFSYALKPRYPARVSIPRSVAYEYYTPDRRVIAPPVEMVVGN
jgi:uncharacterized protein YfaS (alpha-2-macroglobulin family)